MDRTRLKHLIRHALAKGGRQLTPHQVEWHIAGRCLAPVRRELYCRPSRVERGRSYRKADNVGDTFDKLMSGDPAPLTLYEDREGPYSLLIEAKCRRCAQCLRERASRWTARARFELACARRSWLGTLTLSPSWQSHFGNLAALEVRRKTGERFDDLPDEQQLIWRHRLIQREVTLALKRLRASGASVRYLLVLEAHKSGLPHYHILLHEVSEPVRKRTLEAFWRFGFCQWRLVDDPKAARYVAKYLSKDAAARVRASLRYGGSLLNDTIRSKQKVPEGHRGLPPPDIKRVAQYKWYPTGTLPGDTTPPRFELNKEHGDGSEDL